MKTRIDAIIPAYNEEVTIEDVISVIRSSPLVERVIVVSDGSTDRTAEIARLNGAEVIEFDHNKGKGQAMYEGLVSSTSPIIAFFDADLRGLTIQHIARLAEPVLNNTRVMNVGMRDRGKFFTMLAHFLPLESGERVMKRELIEKVSKEYFNGFMLEPALNYLCRANGYVYGWVDLPGLSIRRKYEKVNFFQAVVQYLKMFFQIVYAMIAVRFSSRIHNS